MDIIQKYSNKTWDWDGVSTDPNITPEIVLNNPNKPWIGLGYLQIPILLGKLFLIILIRIGIGLHYLRRSDHVSKNVFIGFNSSTHISIQMKSSKSTTNIEDY